MQSEFRARGRRATVERAGQALPRHPVQAHRAFERRPLRPHEASTLIEEVVAPASQLRRRDRRGAGGGGTAEPIGGRNPAILYGLGNLLENAVDFAHMSGSRSPPSGAQEIAVTITDDGPGFAPEIMERIGEPYVTSRRRERQSADGDAGATKPAVSGSASSLPRRAERSGATSISNRRFDRGSAVRALAEERFRALHGICVLTRAAH